MSRAFTALVDLTVLASPSRARGIGRYAADLGCALAARSGAAADGMSIRAVESLPWIGAAIVSDDAAAVVSRLAAGGQTLRHPQWAWRVRMRLAGAARHADAGVVHSVHPDATPIGKAGCPRVVTCHDVINVAHPREYSTWRDGWSAGRRFLDGRRYRRADHIVAVSGATADDLVRLLSIPERKITVVPNGVDHKRFSPEPQPGDDDVRAELGLGDRPYLLFVGGADWRKNAAGMFDVVAALRRRTSADAPVLAWAGRIDERELTLLKHLAAARGVADHVRLLGWLPDATIAALMRGAGALLFLSRVEGFGYPMIEAMASGCPVVAGRTRASIEIGADAAVLVDLDCTEAAADAAAALLRDDTEKRRVVARGLVRSRSFDVARMADETLAVYRRMIERHN
jgi:glycosyltransferase involved in cell wall biosynthesis